MKKVVFLVTILAVVLLASIVMVNNDVLAGETRIFAALFRIQSPGNTTYYTSDIHLFADVLHGIRICDGAICLRLYCYGWSEYIKYSVDGGENITYCENCRIISLDLTLPHGIHTITLHGYVPEGLESDVREFSNSITFTVHLDSDNDGVPDDEDKCPDTIGEQLVYGCSCHQILDLKPGEDTGEYRNGCSEGTIEVFTKVIGWAKDLFS